MLFKRIICLALAAALIAGMALPVVLYPMAILSSGAALLVPEFARLKAGDA